MAPPIVYYNKILFFWTYYVKYADLHMHTTRSDGSDPPERVVEVAAKVGLSVIAITDHDTVSGQREAARAGERYGVKTIAGVEISTYLGESSVHILGYMMDTKNDDFKHMLAANTTGRRDRMDRMVAKLNSLGYKIELDNLLEYIGEATVGRALLARFLVDRGFFANMNQVFDRVLGDGKAAYEPVAQVTPEEAIMVVKAAGGVTSLAHPGYTGIDSYIEKLVEAGLDAIEVESPQHTSDDKAKFRAIAEKMDLIETGGSDYHGGKLAGRAIGSVRVAAEQVLRLTERAESLRTAPTLLAYQEGAR